MAKYKRMSEEEIRKIIQFHNQGYGPSKIAKLIGRSDVAVIYQIKKIEKAIDKMHEMSIDDYFDKIKPVRNYTKQEIDEIMSLHEKKVPIDEIALKFGRKAGGLRSLIGRVKRLRKVSNPDSGKVIIAEGTRITHTLEDFTYEEILKYLYKRGFRIEDNKLVHYTKTAIKLENIV